MPSSTARSAAWVARLSGARPPRCALMPARRATDAGGCGKGPRHGIGAFSGLISAMCSPGGLFCPVMCADAPTPPEDPRGDAHLTALCAPHRAHAPSFGFLAVVAYA